MELTTAQHDRAAGVLLTQACGDALGVPYEFGTHPQAEPQMLGGGLGDYAPGEWSDDTQMSVCIAEVAQTGISLHGETGLGQTARRFGNWLDCDPADVGIQTRAVLVAARRGGVVQDWEHLREASRSLHERTGRTAGNGALMRTGIVGLSRLDDRGATAASARAVAELTHWDPLAGDSCVLWSEAIRVAVMQGGLDLATGLDLLPAGRRADWQERIQEAETRDPVSFSGNGFTVTALQAAWSSIVHTREDGEGPEHLRAALHTAISIGHDTDTVAAITGALVGARYGASAVPFEWRRMVHGWPGLRARDLVRLGVLTAREGSLPDGQWPRRDVMDTGRERPLAVPHPEDPDVLLGTFADLARVRELGVDAVVSLCRLGDAEFAPADIRPEDHGEVWLVDSESPEDNLHLDWALDEAARAVQQLRREGRRVLLHCVAAHHRTPAVALRYARLIGHDGPQVADRIVGAVGREVDGLLWATARRADY